MINPIGVATRFVPNGLFYHLEVDSISWLFAHHYWWKQHDVEADIWMDRNAPRGDAKIRELAIQDFWDLVYPHIPATKFDAAAILKTAKNAEKAREAKKAGVLELF